MSRTCTQIELIFRIGETSIDTPLTSNREGFERLFGAPDPQSVSTFGCRLRRLEIGLQQVERLLPHGTPIPRHRFGRVVGTCTAVCGPFGYSSYATVVTTDRSSFESGHAKESFRGPSIVVIVASSRRFGRVASYTPPIWASTRTSSPHHSTSRSAFVSASNTCAGIALIVVRASPKTTACGGAGLAIEDASYKTVFGSGDRLQAW